MLCSSDRSVVNLDLDGIVQVLDRHLHDSSTGMMTRIAVLKWLYHLYIKTPRKVSLNVILNMQFQVILKHAMLIHSTVYPWQMFKHTDSLFPMLLKTLSDESDEVSRHIFKSSQCRSTTMKAILKNEYVSQVILKDLEVLAEIASSPAGQTDTSGLCDNLDNKTELHIPGGVRDGQPMVVGE